MIDFIICDDNSYLVKTAEEIVSSVCNKHRIKSNILTFNDYSKEFFDYVKCNKKQSIYILDIEVPSESGVNVCKMIRAHDKKSIIMFITSHNEYAYTVIRDRLNILTFISKISNYKLELRKGVKSALRYVRPDSFVAFSDGKSDYCINANDILYITKNDRKTSIITDKMEYNVYYSIAKLQKLLPVDFIQTHRACIVNKSRIENYNCAQRLIVFDNGMKTDLVSDKYKKEFVLECKS